MRLVLSLVLALVALTPGASAEAPPPAEPAVADVILANVGNVNPSCGVQHVWKLCHTATEDRVASRLQALDADLVVLIEVMPDAVCDRAVRANPFNVCSTRDDRSQVERLVGDGYEIACGRYGWDCLAVRTETGSIDTDFVSLPDPEDCDDGFVVGYADVTVYGEPFRVLLGHPDSGNDACRTAELETLLAQTTGRSLLIGDMNLDPSGSGASVDLWNATVGDGKAFRYHSDPSVLTHAPSDPSALDPTGTLTPSNYNCTAPFGCQALDHVASTWATGACDVLGETPGTERLDGGGGADHRALHCRLTL